MQKPKLKVAQTDFWPGFPYDDNYLLETIRKRYDLILTNQNPDILLYSCYGKDYLNYSCHRIQFITENIRPDFTASDFAFGFDYLNDKRFYRLPLYFFYLLGHTEKLLSPVSRDKAISIWKSKNKFCCMVVSNGLAKTRIQFFHELSKYKQVDSGGKYLNNTGGPVKDKMSFIKDYRFVIAFENSSFPGYTTEKILEPLMADTIPVYWGNPMIEKDFNRKRIIISEKADQFNEVIEHIKSIDQNENLAVEMLQQPIFCNNRIPDFLKEDHFETALMGFIDATNNKRPVAQSVNRYLHAIKRKRNTIFFLVKSKLNRTFR